MNLNLKRMFLLLLLAVASHGLLPAQTLNETQGTGVAITSGDYNTFYGDSTGSRLTTGSYNTIMGYRAGVNHKSSEGTFIGYEAGYSHTTGFDNTLIGWQAGRSIVNAGDNTFIGTESGEMNTSGYVNTFVGEESGTMNTTGYENTFIGEDAGWQNTTGYKQTFIGNETGLYSNLGYRNTGVGEESLSDVDDGHHNTAVGDSAGIDVGDGIYNTFVGAAAGVATEYASYNPFVGAEAGWDNNRTNNTTNANRNTYVGFKTGFSNREGEDNVGMGAYSDFDNTDRSRNTFIGTKNTVSINDVIMLGYSGYNDGQYSINIGNDTDSRKTGAITIGHEGVNNGNAAYAIGIGYQNAMAHAYAIGIGHKVDVDNTEAIGNEAVVQGDYSIAIGSGTSITAENSIALGYQLTVSEQEGAQEVLNYTLKVLNVNDVPELNDQSMGVVENSPAGSFIGMIQAFDEDSDVLTFSILSGNEESVFALDPASGELTVSQDSALDYENREQYILQIQVADADTARQASLIINVENDESDDEILGLKTAGADELEKIQPYPNPTYDVVKLQSDIFKTQEADCQIYNIQGTKFDIRYFKSASDEYTLKLEALPKGLYNLYLRCNEELKILKVVKQ